MFTGASGALYLMARVPLPPSAPQALTTVLTDATGARLASIDSGENRVPVRLDQVPQVVVDAVLAVEDRTFYAHGALDPAGIARAMVADLRGRSLQGGSTITQQYVKNTYLGRERNLWRKAREAALAIKVERNYSKDQILERYLNTVYFGRGAYGVQAAARAYFGKDVGELDLQSAAYLAGLIRAPGEADLTGGGTPSGRARRDRALRAMEASGRISAKQRRAAQATPLEAAEGGHVVDRQAQEPQVVMTDKGTQYFVEYVRSQLVARFGEDATYRQGLRVKTSLDLALQAQAYDAVYGFLKPGEPAGALVSVDSGGRVKAMVGGRDFAESKVNLAVGVDGGGTGRQAGSTFKPFLLAALVKAGYTVESSFAAPAEVVFLKADDGRDYPVSNYEDTDFGQSVNMIDATRNSINTVYAQAQLALGPQKVIDMARAAGITSDLQPNASLVLGTEDVSVLEMAGAYSTFANRGVRVQPHAILEVTTADGTVLPWDVPTSERALGEKEADIVNYCLQQVVSRGSGTGAGFGKPLAGKTGTTQDFGDAWFVGFTPNLTTAVWMGYPEGNARQMVDVRGRKVNGGSFPATMFRRFMQEATRNADYGGTFPKVGSLSGVVLQPKVKGVVFPTSTTTSTTTTTVPGAAAPARRSEATTSTTGPAPPPAAGSPPPAPQEPGATSVP